MTNDNKLSESALQEIRERTPPSERWTALGSLMVEPCQSLHKPNGQTLHICCKHIGTYIEQGDVDRRKLLRHIRAQDEELKEAQAELNKLLSERRELTHVRNEYGDRVQRER